ncbi:MAG: histidinol-phosphate transaminase [Planctomycetes bacterium]|nr:histidinol-phosphate transaminase [Planctomycetota bacterium]
MSYLRKNIKAMTAYTPGEQPAPGERVIKLNTNENPYPPSPRVLEALRTMDGTVLRKYPDPMANKVRDLVAGLFGVGRDNVLCGNGSDELLTLVVRAFVGEGERLAYPTPTYSLYPVLATIQNAATVEAPTHDDFAMPVEELERTRARLLILCNPNAPTGVFTPVETIDRIADRFDGVVVVDEAYVDFSADHAMRLAKERPNVLVLRTLSKSYSLAGLRFGYAVGPDDLIEGLAKVKDSYNVDAVSIELAAAALGDQAWMLANAEKVRRERARLSMRLADLGFAVTPSEANFVLARVPDGAGRTWYENLKADGILVRYWDLPRLTDKLRITVGSPEENDALLAALERLRKKVTA